MPALEMARLRMLLEDAATIARELGDDARPEPDGAGYLADAAASGITKAIEEIASHAGLITMSELPSWNSLVRIS